MKFLKIITTTNSIVLLLCFFLPFIIPMCEGEKKSEPCSADTVEEYDSLAAIYQTDTVQNETTMQVSDSITSNKEENVETLIKYIMMPDGEHVSGIGYIYYYSIIGFSIVSLPISFFLIIIALFFKKRKLKTILISTGLFSFICFGMLNRNAIIYGYWITFAFYLLAAILYWIVFQKEMPQNKRMQG